MKHISYILLCLLIISCNSQNKPQISGEKKIQYANALYNRALYTHAVKAYNDVLDNYKIAENVRININAKIADIYFERLEDYENALAYYLKIIHIFPESEFEKDVQKRKIECLERLGRSVDAAQALKESTQIDYEKDDYEVYSGEVVAEIGDKKITTGYLDHLIKKGIEKLPAQMRPAKIEREQRLTYLRQYLFIELLYKKAMRAGLDKNPEILRDTFQAKKMMMANTIQQQEFADKINITQNDMELYYKANTDKFTEKDKDGKVIKQKSFEEVKDQVYSMVRQEKEREVMDNMLQSLMQAENVKIYTDKVK